MTGFSDCVTAAATLRLGLKIYRHLLFVGITYNAGPLGSYFCGRGDLMLARREFAIVVFAIALALSGRATFAQQIAQQSSDPTNTQDAGQNGGAASAGTAARSDALQLTLKQAVQLGLKQNPERVIARILVAESERNRQIARSVLLPQAGVKSRAALSQYNFQSVEAGPRAAAGPFQVFEAGPAFSQTVLSLPQIRG